MSVSYRVISIGCLDAHPLWNERSPVRTGHGTTTLIVSGNTRVLVDPSLPGPILSARLSERANLQPSEITHVFLTSFRPDLRRGLTIFEDAKWLVGERERETVGVGLVQQLQRVEEEGDEELIRGLHSEIATLRRCEPAPDRIAKDIDLFPLPGVTPGLTGLLLPLARFTVLVCGDAVPTVEHLEQGKVPQWAGDVEAAKESFMEAVDVADLLIPGRDNLTINPTKRPF